VISRGVHDETRLPSCGQVRLISDHRVNSAALRPTPSFIQLHQQQHLNMKSSLLLSLCTAALATAAAQPKDPQAVLQEQQPTIVEADEYLIELSPGETRWVTEEGKWELRRVCIFTCDGYAFMPWFHPIKLPLTCSSKTSTSSTLHTTKSSARSTAIGSLRRASNIHRNPHTMRALYLSSRSSRRTTCASISRNSPHSTLDTTSHNMASSRQPGYWVR